MKKPLVFLDADVIFAGAAAPTEQGASHIVRRTQVGQNADGMQRRTNIRQHLAA